jgi:hypothetical protein
MLTRLLSADAKERLNRIALVKPDKVRPMWPPRRGATGFFFSF